MPDQCKDGRALAIAAGIEGQFAKQSTVFCEHPSSGDQENDRLAASLF